MKEKKGGGGRGVRADIFVNRSASSFLDITFIPGLKFFEHLPKVKKILRFFLMNVTMKDMKIKMNGLYFKKTLFCSINLIIKLKKLTKKLCN